MYKYLNLAFLFGATFFVNTAHAAGVIPVPTPHSTGLTYVESTASGADFSIPQTDGTTKYYKVNYTYPYGTTSSSRISSATSDITNQHFRGQGYTGETGGGGAVAVQYSSTINITASFIENYKSGSYNGSGGAIYNSGTISNLTGFFYKNYVYTGYNNRQLKGGAIYNGGKIGSITADFVGNKAYAWSSSDGITGGGGAIYHYQPSQNNAITSITGNFIGSSAPGAGGAIYHRNNGGQIQTITGDFISNAAKDDGGAIYLYGTPVGTITGNFLGNSAFENEDVDIASGGAIYASGTSPIGTITGSFYGNSSAYEGGAIYTDSNIGIIRGDFTNNFSDQGGAIYNGRATISYLTGNFTGNSASRQGGAIYNAGAIGIYAETQDVVFYGNTDPTGYNDIAQAVHSSKYDSIINLNASTGKKISFGGSIRAGTYSYEYGIININNHSSASNRGGQYIFNNTVSYNRFNLYSFGAIC